MMWWIQGSIFIWAAEKHKEKVGIYSPLHTVLKAYAYKLQTFPVSLWPFRRHDLPYFFINGTFNYV